METANSTGDRVLIVLLKDFKVHTATSLSKELRMSRWGVWKVLKKFEGDQFIRLDKVGAGKTGTYVVKLNWENILMKKTLALCLIREALKYKRWRYDFETLEKEVEFLILFGSVLYSAKEANDIDILGVAKKNKMRGLGDVVLGIQQTQSKKIHFINFTKEELKQELKEKNRAWIDAIRKGVVLYGQENFVNFMKGGIN